MGKLRDSLASSSPRLTGHELNRRRDLLHSLQRKERSLRDVVGYFSWSDDCGDKLFCWYHSYIEPILKVNEAPRGGGARDQLLGRLGGWILKKCKKLLHDCLLSLKLTLHSSRRLDVLTQWIWLQAIFWTGRLGHLWLGSSNNASRFNYMTILLKSPEFSHETGRL